MFKKLIEKSRRKKVKKNTNGLKFTIKDLCVADIVLIKNREYENGKIHNSYQEITKSVIVENLDNKNFGHIKSKQILTEAYWAQINDYALVNIRKFSDKFETLMRKQHLSNESQLSSKQVIQLEDALQTGIIDDLLYDEIFK